MDSLYNYLIIVHKCGYQCDKVEGVNIKQPLNLANGGTYNNGQSGEFKTESYDHHSGITNVLFIKGSSIIFSLYASVQRVLFFLTPSP